MVVSSLDASMPEATDRDDEVNGVNAAELKSYRDQVIDDSAVADRDPSVVAHWEGGTRSKVEYGGETLAYMNGDGDDDLNAMVTMLASLASCDVEVITTEAAFLGVEIEDLSIEANGHFNVARLVGVGDAPSPSYDDIEYVISLKAPDATPEQIAALKEQCESASPVGQTLGRSVPLRMEFQTD